jgi:hypothetical protein
VRSARRRLEKTVDAGDNLIAGATGLAMVSVAAGVIVEDMLLVFVLAK